MREPNSSLLMAVFSAALLGCGGGAASSGSGGGPAAGSGGTTAGSGGQTTPGSGGVIGSGGAPGSGGTIASPGGAGGKQTGGAGGHANSMGGRGGRGTGGTPASSGGITGAAGMPASGGSTGAGGIEAPPTAYKGVANSPCNDQKTFGVAWYYNWTTTPEKNCTAAEFVPMVAGKSEKTADAVTSAITNITKAGYKTVLGFNEPNKSDQANLTVDQVVAMWPALTANADLRVGSPATSADSNGQQWFTQFMGDVSTNMLRVDFVALHWYGWNAGSCDAKAANLESYIKWAEGVAGDRPLWLTEWGCMNDSNPDAATVQAFFQGALTMFWKHPRLQRYAWYPWNTNNELVDDNDQLTSLGMVFSAAPQDH